MKDPAFLFYSGDFLAGTQFLTNEQKGMYITLLCMQHQQGHIKHKHMLMICGRNDEEVFGKFMTDADGLYYHPRMEAEMEKRKNYSESRRSNRMKGQGTRTQHKQEEKQEEKHAEKGLGKTEKQEQKQREKEKDVKIMYPYKSAGFMKVWEHWKDYKSREYGFKYASAQSEQAALKRLVKLSGGVEQTATEIIVESMANGWKGLFELQNNHKHGRGNNPDRYRDGENNPGIKQAIFDIIGDTTGCF